MNPPSPTIQRTGRLGLRNLRSQGRREAVAQIERISGINVGLGIVHLVVGTGVVSQLSDVPDDEGILRHALLDGFNEEVLWFHQTDVVVSNESAGCRDICGGRWASRFADLQQNGKESFQGGLGVAVEGDRICLNAGELVVIYVYVNERGGGFPAGLPREKRAPIPMTTSASLMTLKSWFISCRSPRGLKQEP